MTVKSSTGNYFFLVSWTQFKYWNCTLYAISLHCQKY